MKLLSLILFLLMFGVLSNASAQTPGYVLKTEKDSLGYALGLDNLRYFNSQNWGQFIDYAAFAQSYFDAASGKPLLTEEQTKGLLERLQQKMQAYQAEQQAKQQAEALAQADVNKAEGKKFLEENGKRKGVVTTTSGMQYEIITEGTGKTPTATDNVTVHYTGTLIDGTKFDSSVDRGTPATFPLDKVIAGWTEGLQLLKEGGKAKLYIPSNLAYGDQAMQGSPIKPGSTLIFEVELIKIGE